MFQKIVIIVGPQSAVCRHNLYGEQACSEIDGVDKVGILDVIPASVANTEFGKLLPSLADGTCTPEQFAQWMSDKAAEASAE